VWSICLSSSDMDPFISHGDIPPAIQMFISSLTMESVFSLDHFSTIAADLHYVLLLGQPLPEFPCTAWHISSQPAPSVPLVLSQCVLLVSPVSRTYFGHLRSIVKIEKSSLVVSVSLSPQPMVPSSQILAMSIFLCRSSHFPGCVEFSTLSASLLSDGVLQHHDSYIPTLECY